MNYEGMGGANREDVSAEIDLYFFLTLGQV